MTIEKLKTICHEEEKDKNFYIAPITRRISIRITALLIRTPITANQLSAICILMGLLAGALLSFGIYYYSIVGGFMLILFLVVDTVDGEVARYWRKANQEEEGRRGKLIEFATHMIVMPFIFISLSYGVFNGFGDLRSFVFGFSSVMFFMLYHVAVFYVSHVKGLDHAVFALEINSLRKIRKFVFNLLSSSLLPAIVLICALLDILFVALVFYGIAFPILAISYLYIQFMES